jgi:hypothetical protein
MALGVLAESKIIIAKPKIYHSMSGPQGTAGNPIAINDDPGHLRPCGSVANPIITNDDPALSTPKRVSRIPRRPPEQSLHLLNQRRLSLTPQDVRDVGGVADSDGTSDEEVVLPKSSRSHRLIKLM